MLRVEFHCHTIYSKDSLTRPGALIRACKRKGIDRIVVTDHNTIEGAVRAQELDGERVIIGEEIMTTQGEILAAFVTEEIPPGLHPIETIELLRSQGAFISVSHPFDRMRSGAWDTDNLRQIAPLVDAIEVFNARCFLTEYNWDARDFAQQHHLAGTVGSDAHALFEIGKATLLLPDFEDAYGLRSVILQGLPKVSLSGPWVHFASRYAVWRKRVAIKTHK